MAGGRFGCLDEPVRTDQLAGGSDVRRRGAIVAPGGDAFSRDLMRGTRSRARLKRAPKVGRGHRAKQLAGERTFHVVENAPQIIG